MMGASDLKVVEIDETPPRLDLVPEEVEALADQLAEHHAEFADLYYRLEQAHWGYNYLQGLMLPIERKVIQPMAQSLEGGNIQSMQQFIGQGRWQDEVLLQKHWRLVDKTLGEEDGGHSVGVARQWCGTLGKVENCQVRVFTAYASRKGYTLVDRLLYLPKAWFDEEHRKRWVRCGIPDDTPFKSKPQLALEMLGCVVADGSLCFRWVACDEGYGDNSAFLDGVAALGRCYFAEVPQATRLWEKRPATEAPSCSGRGRRLTGKRLKLGEPSTRQVREMASSLSPAGWKPYAIKEGSQGPMVAEFTFRRGVAVRDGLSGPEVWFVFRCSLGDDPELKFYLSRAPADTPVTELVRMAGMRWPGERGGLSPEDLGLTLGEGQRTALVLFDEGITALFPLESPAEAVVLPGGGHLEVVR